jgi:hypothetical protein
VTTEIVCFEREDATLKGVPCARVQVKFVFVAPRWKNDTNIEIFLSAGKLQAEIPQPGRLCWVRV